MTWLRLLADDRDATELEALRAERLAAGADPELTDAEASSALRIHARLRERRRHAIELAALNELARRLATLHDPQAVLGEVAAQARRLLGVDVAYLMLARSDAVLRMAVVDGSIGAALRGIELPPGQGLAGTVMRTGRPIGTENFSIDHRFPHVPNVDAAVSSEHLGGIIGVPLSTSVGTIGVLGAADRRPREFTAQEIELLAALGSHAAVAIGNARLFEENRQALADLERANAALRRSEEARREIDALRDRLTATVLRRGSASAIADEMERALGAVVSVFDADGTRLTGRGLRLDELLDNLSLGSVTGRVRGPAGPAIVAPVGLPTGWAGCLVAHHPTPGEFGEDAERVLALGATTMALVMASEQTAAEAELRTRGEVLAALLSPEADEAAVRRRARAAHVDVTRVSAVAVLLPSSVEDGDDPRGAAGHGARTATELRGWSAEHAGVVVVLVPDTVPEQLRDRLANGLPTGIAVGVAECSGGVTGVRDAHEAARHTAAVLHALERTERPALSNELGIYRILLSHSGRGEGGAFVQATIGPLLTHDRHRGRELVATLKTYLDHSEHHTRTCEALHVHANTLYRRLDRISELLGPRWRAPDRLLEIRLALHLHSLLARL
ncbi:helix-turn-helix domain-containing protein [Pseudonocardia parietis]|uniref:GAF domain-containing protein n=1 Tax=Pseudonocardia parietis TaxID=570936 RepID=A0ABS4W5Z1_9PSEU|nr:GAF domain-containing protein [Pseudonocardia parietis]MBP2371625.1 GAF domain-containing protein [Pseudonocardia parietis]